MNKAELELAVNDSFKPFTASKILQHIESLEREIERTEDDVVAYQSDLHRVSDRHDVFLDFIIGRYECPPDCTSDTCPGEGLCRECWLAWAERQETK